MLKHIIDDFFKLSPETQWLVVAQVIALVGAVIKSFTSSKKATFFEKAHEAVVVGIEHSNCEDCRQAAKNVTKELGIDHKVKPVVKAIKQTFFENKIDRGL
jgi:purine nucleoside phosphorylase